MITKVNNGISTLKNLFLEVLIDQTSKLSNVADGSVVNAIAFGVGKVAQKAIKDIAIVEAQLFPEYATGDYLNKSAALFGVSPERTLLVRPRMYVYMPNREQGMPLVLLLSVNRVCVLKRMKHLP